MCLFEEEENRERAIGGPDKEGGRLACHKVGWHNLGNELSADKGWEDVRGEQTVK